MSSSSSTVDGLVSGLDTSSIITSLLSVDAAPQAQLKTKLSTANTKVTAYQSINTKLSALQTAADALQKAATWASTVGTSTDSSISVTADSTATPASLNVQVMQVAAGRVAVSNADLTTDSSGVLTSASATNVPVPMDIVRPDGTYLTIAPTSGTLSDVVKAINSASAFGVKAVAIRTADNTYRLQITSSTTGATAGDFKIVAHDSSTTASTGSDGTTYGTTYSSITEASTYNSVTSAADAKIKVGPTGSQFDVTSTSNTFNDVMTGVDITVSQVTAAASGSSSITPATITVASDTDTIATAMDTFISAANAALTDIAAKTLAGTVGSDGKVSGGGALKGDSMLRSLKSQILSAVSAALGSSGTSASTLGVQTTSDGALKFDKDVFTKAYVKDATSVEKLVSSVAAGTSSTSDTSTDGLVERLRKITVYAVGDAKVSGSTATGALTSVITGQNTTITDLTNRISDWDTKLAAKKEYYSSYYSKLEVALGKLQSQSTWLSGQLSSLSSS